ncbi:LOW QUALITY PROTEIN: G-protein coupled receptor GRL101-like [Argopecten irradians]|uniref:LOW QUALITY PROTEIN: G-protein coupled receptor GRL101-like n=1 Tax=Argopecten irradians TaxID=31199 RepID=UPI003717AA30
MELNCSSNDLSPPTWYYSGRVGIINIQTDKDRWKYRTKVRHTTFDNVSSSLVQIKYMSIGDEGVYICRSQRNQKSTAVIVLYDKCEDNNMKTSIYVPGKGCLSVVKKIGSDAPCKHITISDWRDQLVASDLIRKYYDRPVFSTGIQNYLIDVNNEERNFQWKHFIRGKSKRLTFTAWKGYDYGDEYSTCVGITPFADVFSNWVYSLCSMDHYICLNTTGIKNDAVQLPTRVPDTDDVSTISTNVLDRMFQCRQTKEFILSYFVCDYRTNCMDRSDEDKCPTSETDGSLFSCDNGKVISLNLVCDYYPDCYDGSDEHNCYKAPCLSGQWTCHNGQCIPDYDVCDSELECWDGSDEWTSTCHGHPKLIESIWPCYSSRHVSIYRMCDKIPDCHDGSDENSCFLGNPTYSCSTMCPVKSCNVTTARVHLGGSGYETVSCFYHNSTVSMMTWPFSAYIDTSPGNEDCFFTIQQAGSVFINLVTTQAVPIQYKSEHILKELLRRSRQCYQYVEFCYRTESALPPTILFSSDRDGRRMRNFTICATVRNSCDHYFGCVNVKDTDHPSCHGKTTVLTGSDVPIRWIQPRSNEKPKTILLISPPICEEDDDLIDLKYSEPQMMCQNGMTYYPHHQCLMDFDVTGEPSACRDLTHLQNCENFTCPVNFVKCPHSYCVHARFLCDGISHCPNTEDERECDSFGCPGYFRCQNSKTCIPLEQVCDGIRQCPRADDERHCDVICPDSCSCRGLLFHCVDNQANNSQLFYDLPKTIKGLNVRTRLSEWTNHLPLTFPAILSLSMNHCQIASLFFGNYSVLTGLESLVFLDLSYNDIRTLPAETFAMVPSLESLILSDNPIVNIEDMAFSGLRLLKTLNLYGLQLRKLSSDVFVDCDALHCLNLSSNQIETIGPGTFKPLTDLKTLDLSKNYIELKEDIFDGLSRLETLYVDSYTLCCARPVSVTDANCFAPRDNISSCSDLIRLYVLRAALWIMAVCATFGNLSVLIYRLKYDRINLTKSYSIFVINLCLSDMLMGVYMIIIGVADALYRDIYVWEEKSWRQSIMCTVSGVLSMISSETSTFLILLISLDRTIAIVFPFSLRQFKMKSAVLISVTLWIIGVLIALLPVTMYKDYFRGEFYSSSGVCLALPLSGTATPGSEYSVAIFVGLNFVIFLTIALCQVVIFRESRTHRSLRRTTSKHNSDIRVARGLTAVIATDFLCWFPIGVLGIWTICGGSVSGDTYAWIMVLVLPINSAVNPFLYTLANTWNRRQSHRPHSSSRSAKSETEMTNVVLDVLNTFRHRRGSMYLHRYLCNPEKDLKVRDAFNIVRHLVASLLYLHKQDLVHGSITTESVEIQLKNDRVTDAGFTMDHRRVPDNSEQLDDIRDFGLLVKVLLRKIKVP